MDKTKDSETKNIQERWHKWINHQYLEYRGLAIGRERTVTEFARYVGLTQPTMTNLMNKSVPSRAKTIQKFVRIYGPEVYDVLGMERPDFVAELENQLKSATPTEKDRIIRRIKDLAALYGAEIKNREK